MRFSWYGSQLKKYLLHCISVYDVMQLLFLFVFYEQLLYYNFTKCYALIDVKLELRYACFDNTDMLDFNVVDKQMHTVNS